jgi:DNA-binding LacI/PurR family transcriptional regulator
MRDVAQLAGVSHQTVSRVLNNHPTVRGETRERVLEAMRSLNYRRNSVARALVTSRSRTLGIVGFDTTSFGPASMLYGIEEAAREAGYLTSVVTVREIHSHSVLDAVDRLMQHIVEGVIAIAPNQAVMQALALAPAGLRCVTVGGARNPAAIPAMCIDNAAGARLATEHLLGLGHRTVHHAAGPPDWPDAQERRAGWRAALDAAGRRVPPADAGRWDAGSGYQQGRRLAADPSVTAVFCANDRIALGVLRAMHEAGRRVPAEVSVVGFDDTPESGFYLPPLTTIRQNLGELGRRSFGMLLRWMAASDGDQPPDQVLVMPELVVRASSGPAPSRVGW